MMYCTTLSMYTNGYSVSVCPLCVLENGGLSECYTLYITCLSFTCNGSEKRYYLALFCRCRVDLVEIVVILLVIRIQHLVYPLTLSFIPNMMLLKRKASTYTYHFALWITLYTTQLLAQRLVTTSASLRALKLDYTVLFFQVLNIKSLPPKWFCHFCSH